jgi:hypothetical protein
MDDRVVMDPSDQCSDGQRSRMPPLASSIWDAFRMVLLLAEKVFWW